MTKKMFYLLVGFVMLTFLFSFTVTTPLFAQEQQREEDIEDFSLEDLLNVEITTAGKQAEKISEVPASVVLVTRDDIEKYGYRTLEEVLENIPGLYKTNDFTAVNFGVRGFWTPEPQRNVVILVNGIRQTDDLTTSNYLQQINMPVEAIDRIEVVRGPMSVIYGTGAFFGVINIITNQVADGKPSSMVAIAFGSENTKKVVARTAGKEGDFQYAFTGSYEDTAGLDIPYDSIENSAVLEAYGVAPGSTTDGLFDHDKSFLNFSGKLKGFTFDASYTESHKEILLILPSVSNGTELLDRVLRVYFGYENELSEKTRLALRFGYFQNRRSFDYDWLFDGFYGIQLDGAFGYEANLNLFFNPSDKLSITLGVDYRRLYEVRNDLDVPAFGLSNANWDLADDSAMVTQAIFAQFNYKFSDKLKLVAGARVEQVPEWDMTLSIGDAINGVIDGIDATYSETQAEFIPRVALLFSPNEKNVFKFLYGKAINRPSFFQLTEVIFIPGESLLPETIQTLELNYIGTFSPKFQVNLSIFRNSLRDLIFRTLNFVGADYISYYNNVGEIDTNGVEVTLTAKPSSSFSLELSGTFQKTKDKLAEDIDVGYSPTFLGYIKASYFFNKDISIAVTGNYVGEMLSFYDSEIPGRLGDKVDGYFLLGANLRFRNLFGKGMFLNIRGSNLLDEEIFFPTTQNNSLFATKGTVGRGIFFLATLGWKF
jgi:outer membrane receptor for ferrienterochelin and colicin